MSDCGAMSFPTVITSPMRPLLAKESSAGVEAACNGVRSPNLGFGRSPTPSSSMYIIVLLSVDTGLNGCRQIYFYVCCLPSVNIFKQKVQWLQPDRQNSSQEWNIGIR